MLALLFHLKMLVSILYSYVCRYNTVSLLNVVVFQLSRYSRLCNEKTHVDKLYIKAMQILSTAATDITTLKNVVYGVVLGIALPYPNFPPEMKNVCTLGDSSSSCPIKKGDKFTEKVIVPISDAAISGVSLQSLFDCIVFPCMQLHNYNYYSLASVTMHVSQIVDESCGKMAAHEWKQRRRLL